MSFLKIILITICLPLISSEDLCQLIAPNGSYKGLGIYKTYNYSNQIHSFFHEFWMYNKQGMEWKVMLDINETNDVNIEVDYQSIQAINTSIVKRLEFVLTPILGDWPLYSIFHCDILKYEREANYWEIVCKAILVTSTGSHIKVRDGNDWLDSVFINHDYPKPIRFILVNKKNKTIKKYLYYDRYVQTMIAIQCNQMTCPDIEFIQQMDDSLVRQIDSVVDYYNRLTFRHLLLFDINGRPYYCIQTNYNNISEQVCYQHFIRIIFIQFISVFIRRQFQTTI